MIKFLMTGMLAWMNVNCAVVDEIHPKHSPCQYNYNVTLPKVVFLSQKDLKYQFYSRGSSAVGSNEKVDLFGFYRRNEYTIFLDNTWDEDDIYDRGTLFHELYHHVQFRNNSIERCITHREIPAVMFAKKYAKSLGNYEYISTHMYDAPCNVYYKGLIDYGQGTYTSHDGSMYVGSWKDGKQHGQGTYTYYNGDKYVGEFKDGKQHGQGTYTWPDESKEVGEFRGDKSWSTTEYDKDGNIIGKWVNGEKQ